MAHCPGWITDEDRRILKTEGHFKGDHYSTPREELADVGWSSGRSALWSYKPKPMVCAPSAQPASVAAVETTAPHRSPRFTSSCNADCDSPTIAWPALQQSDVTPFRPRHGGIHCLCTRLGNAGQQNLGQTVHQREQGLLCSPKPGDLPADLAILVASRSSAPSIVASRPFNSWSIAPLRKALGLA